MGESHNVSAEYNLILNKLLQNDILIFDDVMNSGKLEEIMTRKIQALLAPYHPYAISVTKDGRWLTEIPDTSKVRGTRQIRRKTEQELYTFLLKFYNIVIKEKGGMKFKELFADWIEYKLKFVKAENKKRALSPSTIRRYQRDYNNYLKGSELDNSLIFSVTTTKLMSWISDIIRSKGLKDKSAQNIIGYIKSIFAYAYQAEYIDKDPAARIDKALLLSMAVTPIIKSDKSRILNQSECNALMLSVERHLKRYPYYMPDYAIKLAMSTGMRVGEISALRWSDIRNDTIYIDYSEHRLDYIDKTCDYVIDEPKNGKHRQIPLWKELMDLLNEIGNLGITSSQGWIFARKDGSRYTGHDISCAVARRGLEAGIEGTVSIHQIRRTVSSALNAIKLPRATIANLLGHSEEVNARHYDYDITERNDVIVAFRKLGLSTSVNNFSDKEKVRKAL